VVFAKGTTLEIGQNIVNGSSAYGRLLIIG
jgi:hypothetical protein